MAATTIAFEEIERSSSSTLSESSIYFDIDDEGVEISSSSPRSVASMLKDVSEGPISPRIEPPSTPTRPTISLHIPFNKFEITPSSSSERSTNLSSSNTEPESYSPITERSRSSSITSDDLALSPPTTSISRDPCLQCFLAGLSCSTSERRTKSHTKPTSCRRCARNGECFCIFQVAIEKPEDCYRRRGSDESDYTYYAEGVEKEVVLEKAEELLEVKRAKTRFALPKLSLWKRQILSPVFGGWVVNDDGLVEVEVEG